MDISRTEVEIFNYNNSPLEKLSGLSPYQTHELIHNPLGENSFVKFSSNINTEILDQVPFFKISEALLKIIQRDGFIKLTPLGALPKKTLVELYEHKFIPEYFIESGTYKLHREDDCITLKTARIVCELSNLVKKSKGKLLLTKNGERCLKAENRVELFKVIYLIFTQKFNWAFNDGYCDEPLGQYGSLFSIYLLKKFGDEVNLVTFYSSKYLQVFKKFLTLFQDDYLSSEKQFNDCYTIRTFERFTEWFGFSTITGKQNYFDVENEKVVKTMLLDQIFVFDANLASIRVIQN